MVVVCRLGLLKAVCSRFSTVRGMASKRVIIYGGKGALGSEVLNHFKSKQFWTLSVDLHKNDNADASVIVGLEDSWTEQEKRVLNEVSHALGGSKVDAVLCVAGGWAGGNAASAETVTNADLMWKQSVWSSLICARIASIHLNTGGLIQLTGAAAALDGGCPSMIGYGMAKAAVHQLTRSLAGKGSGLPVGASSLAILPSILDTPMNRKFMPKADFKSWTPLPYVAELLYKWTTEAGSRPSSGALVKFSTEGGTTTLSEH